MNLSREDYDRIKEVVYQKSGIALKGDKQDFVARRVVNRMGAVDMQSIRDYCRYLVFDPDGKEISELINLIVIGETYFFREFDQLRLLAEDILPLIVEKKKKTGKKQLKLLSAGCATGEEAYTLAIILKEMLDQPNEWEIRIEGIDINSASVKKAKQGHYTDHALRETPYAYRDKYFRSETGGYAIRSGIKEMVSLSGGNLYDRAEMSRFIGYDVVFCRNVLIYFDRKSAAQVLENLYRTMNPGGYIFSGLAESIGRLTSVFQMERFNKAFVYRK